MPKKLQRKVMKKVFHNVAAYTFTTASPVVGLNLLQNGTLTELISPPTTNGSYWIIVRSRQPPGNLERTAVSFDMSTELPHGTSLTAANKAYGSNQVATGHWSLWGIYAGDTEPGWTYQLTSMIQIL
jgi:hypothetical protein